MLAMYNLFNGCTRPGGGARPKAYTLGLNFGPCERPHGPPREGGGHRRRLDKSMDADPDLHTSRRPSVGAIVHRCYR
jgi:hypothetical protein